MESSSLSSTDPRVHKLANKLLALKKKIYQGSFSALYKDIPRWPYPNVANKYAAKNQNKLPSPLERLVLEVPPSNSATGYYEVDLTNENKKRLSSQGIFFSLS